MWVVFANVKHSASMLEFAMAPDQAHRHASMILSGWNIPGHVAVARLARFKAPFQVSLLLWSEKCVGHLFSALWKQ